MERAEFTIAYFPAPKIQIGAKRRHLEDLFFAGADMKVFLRENRAETFCCDKLSYLEIAELHRPRSVVACLVNYDRPDAGKIVRALQTDERFKHIRIIATANGDKMTFYDCVEETRRELDGEMLRVMYDGLGIFSWPFGLSENPTGKTVEMPGASMIKDELARILSENLTRRSNRPQWFRAYKKPAAPGR